MVTNKQIEKWNNYFNGLSPEQKRVAIAEDVLLQMKTKKIVPHSGTYFKIDDDGDIDSDSQISLQKLLPRKTCQTCALGALFHSHIKYNNKVTFKDYYNDPIGDLITSKLKDYFIHEQLSMIEYAFEGFHGGIFDVNPMYASLNGQAQFADNVDRYENIPQDFIKKLQDSNSYFHHLEINDENYDYEDFRMYQIMHNIIRNNGTFVPTDLKIEKWKTKKKTVQKCN
jgi:heat shock protein HspQ